MSLRFQFLSILSLFMLLSCNDSTFEDNNTDIGLEYFPLELGNEWIYEVDSLILQQSGGDIFINTSFVKEEVTAVINEEENSFVITSSVRQSVDQPWVVTEVNSGILDDDQAFKTEGNLRFTKLVFPIREGKSWDGNTYFDDQKDVDIFGNMFPLYNNWNYEYFNVDTTFNIGGQDFNSIVKVEQADIDDGIDYVRSYEDYAKGVGLVYKELAHFHTQQLTSTQPWEEKAEFGFRVIHRLVSFTK